MANRICEWITLTVVHDIHSPGTLPSIAWVEVLRALWARHDFEGYEDTHWGRVLEEESKLWIWTSWGTKKAYDQQRETEIYRSLRKKLSILSLTPPVTSLLQFDDDFTYPQLYLHHCWPSITIAYFRTSPSVNEQSEEEELSRIRGIRGMWPSRRILGDFAVYGPPARGFLLHDIDSVIPSSSAPARVYVFLDYWITPVREEEVRGPEELIPINNDNPSPLKRLSTLFEEQLQEAGCVKKVVLHARFEWALGVDFPDDEIKMRSLVYDWEEGRRERRRVLKKKYGIDKEEDIEESSEQYAFHLQNLRADKGSH
ncbi:uncharacterized protein BDR25DRAFT_346623, partial [Lindgomyces ingoldianus]